MHRSNLDSILVACTARDVGFEPGKESLFLHPVFAWANAALGAIPVRQGEADRRAMKATQTIIADGTLMIVFPEGTRQSGDQVLGVSTARPTWLTRPVRRSFPSGSGERSGDGERLEGHPAGSVFGGGGRTIAAPEGRLSQPQRHAFSENVSAEEQKVFDRAISMAAD